MQSRQKVEPDRCVDDSERCFLEQGEAASPYACVSDALEGERQRITSELHDGLGQGLAALKFQVDGILAAHHDQVETLQIRQLKSVASRLQNLLDDLRNIVYAVRPSVLDMGLIRAVQAFCHEFRCSYPGIRLSTSLSVVEDEVPAVVKAPIYRILQEALNNVAKHAEASASQVSLNQEYGRLCLRVSDNGRGFVGGYVGMQKGGIGLASMKARSVLSFGAFKIHTAEGRGTVVEASWPLSGGLPLDQTVFECVSGDFADTV